MGNRLTRAVTLALGLVAFASGQAWAGYNPMVISLEATPNPVCNCPTSVVKITPKFLTGNQTPTCTLEVVRDSDATAVVSTSVLAGTSYDWSVGGVQAGGYKAKARSSDNVSPPWIEVPITVVQIKSIEVVRKGSSDSPASSTSVAAGGIESDVHTAEVTIKISPVPATPYSVNCKIELQGAEGDGGNNVQAKLYIDSKLLITGDSSAEVTFSNSAGEVKGELISSNKIRTCTIRKLNDATVSASVDFKWDRDTDVEDRWDYSESYAYDVFEPVSYTLELASSTGIDQHELEFSVKSVSYVQLDLETWEWVDCSDASEDLDSYSIFRDDSSGGGDGKVTTDSSGKATAYQKVFFNPGGDWTILVYDVKFKFHDRTVYK